MLGNFAFLSSAVVFFQHRQENLDECQTVGTKIWPEKMSGINWVKCLKRLLADDIIGIKF